MDCALGAKSASLAPPRVFHPHTGGARLCMVARSRKVIGCAVESSPVAGNSTCHGHAECGENQVAYDRGHHSSGATRTGQVAAVGQACQFLVRRLESRCQQKSVAQR